MWALDIFLAKTLSSVKVTHILFSSSLIAVTLCTIRVPVETRLAAVTLATNYVVLASALPAVGITANVESGYSRLGAVAQLATHQWVAAKGLGLTLGAVWMHGQWGADTVSSHSFTQAVTTTLTRSAVGESPVASSTLRTVSSNHVGPTAALTSKRHTDVAASTHFMAGTGKGSIVKGGRQRHS